MDRNRDLEHWFDSYVPHRDDKYQYYYFSPEEFPAGALLARQIQAQSYVNNRIVRPEGLVTLENGAVVLSPEVTNPSGVPYVPPPGSRTEYAFGIEKGTTDLSPITGRMVAWKKFHAPPDMPLEALPAYQFSRDNLWPEGEEYLRRVTSVANLVVVEPESLGKTDNAGPGVIKEFIRSEVQRVFGRGEIWFMGLVEKTAYHSWVHNWGPTVVRQIGDSRLTPHPHMYDGVALVPTIIDIDNFFANMAQDILTPGNESADRQLAEFVYMSDGISNFQLGPGLAAFRADARRRLRPNE